MTTLRHPLLYQVNTRVYLTGLSRCLGRPATLDDIPDSDLAEWSRAGFDWIWLLSVWQTGPEAQAVSRTNTGWRAEFQETLPDLTDADIAGSGFAVTGYTTHAHLGGDAALARLRDRLRGHGLKLMLDFVPNHMGLGHPWLEEHPEFFIEGTEADLERNPQNFLVVRGKAGEKIFAHGRDPYFPGWPDTVQLNYANAALREAMGGELARIAGQCDGVRCDMAMLVLPEVFQRTWGLTAAPFWPQAIGKARQANPGFILMAEVYWDLEWELQQQGFDYTYDKRLYDRLREGPARPVREHLKAEKAYQQKLARFLENHDEPRAAATFPGGMHEAAAVITYLQQGLRFFHQGQLEGKKVRISPHLIRGPEEPVDKELQGFYQRLLAVLRQDCVREGTWHLLEISPAWEGNSTWENFVAFTWKGQGGERLVVAVNYSSQPGQCHIRIPFEDLSDGVWRLEDQLGSDAFDWRGSDLTGRGLFLDEPRWKARVFRFIPPGR